MRSRIITIALVAMLVVVGSLLANNLGWINTASGQDTNPTPPTPVPLGTKVTLATFAFVPGETRTDILAWADQGVVFVNDAQALHDVVRDGRGAVVYVNEQGLQTLDDAWLKAKHSTGVAFGGVGIALSELSGKVGSEPDLPDLDLAYGEGKVQLSFSFEAEDSGRGSLFYYTDYWTDLTIAPLLMEHAIIPVDQHTP